MDLIKLSISPAFIRKRARLTWREVLFGIENELLASGAAVEVAGHELGAHDNPPEVLVQLASLGKGEPTRGLVEQLANAAPKQEPAEVRGKWLYLVLGWIFEHRQSYPDPLQTVEEVYADFGYPECVSAFVRYMPTHEPDLGSRELNERRLYENWQRFLDDEGGKLAGASARANESGLPHDDHASREPDRQPETTNQDIVALEYDWLAVDAEGLVALFSTAGGGYAPAALLADTDAFDAAIATVLSMPGSTTTATCTRELPVDLINTWKLVAERGLFAFDSDPPGGPYRLIAAPTRPVCLQELPPIVRDVAGRVVLSTVAFRVAREISEREIPRRES
jgi:hypothetical protein